MYIYIYIYIEKYRIYSYFLSYIYLKKNSKYELSKFQLTKMVQRMPHLKVLTLIASLKIKTLGFLPKLIEACPSLRKLYILPLSLNNPKQYDRLMNEIENYNTKYPNQNLKVYLYNQYLE